MTNEDNEAAEQLAEMKEALRELVEAIERAENNPPVGEVHLLKA